jgi:hypothetical protein
MRSIELIDELWISCYLFTVTFFLLLGPKIGYLDLSILIPFALLLPYSRLTGKISSQMMIVCGLASMLLVYQLAVILWHNTFEPEPILRLLRALLVTALGIMVISIHRFTANDILKAIYACLLTHAIIIVIAALIPEINELISIVSGNDRWRPYRSSGFLAGFDIAGFLCIVGVLMLALRIIKNNSKWITLSSYTVFSVAVFFTSRVTMALFVAVIVVTVLANVIKSKLYLISKVFLLCIFFAFSSTLFYLFILPIVEVTFALGLLNVSESDKAEITSRHAVQDSSQLLWSDMFFLPDSEGGILFGAGIDQELSDVGYIRDIFRFGIIGCLITYLLHIYIWRKSVLFWNFQNKRNEALLVSCVLILTFLLSFKNSYFFTRAIFPLIILLFCTSYKHNKNGSC